MRPCSVRLIRRQVAAFGSVALYQAYYVGEAKLEIRLLYIVIGTLAVIWAVSFGGLLLIMERKYVKTFFSTETGSEFVMNHFLDNAGNDELRVEIFMCNLGMWRPIRPQVVAWLRVRFKIWRREKPPWFTAAVCASIPTDMLPTSASRWLDKQAGGRRSTIHDSDASLQQRLGAQEQVARNRVAPLGVAEPEPQASGSASSDSSDSDSAAEMPVAVADTRSLPEAGTEGESAVGHLTVLPLQPQRLAARQPPEPEADVEGDCAG